MTKIVIIGAGLTGLSAAYHLEQAGYTDYELFEQEEEVGGLCRSWRQDGFTFDYTGHLLHLSNTYAEELVNQIFPREQFAHIQRRSAIYSHNTYTRYPFQINLHGLPSQVIIDCIESFVNRPRASSTDYVSFREWVLVNFGEGIGRNFFFPYQQKIFDIDIDELSASWTGRFVPSTSLGDLLRGAFGMTTDEVGYNATFFYPKAGGIIRWVQGLHNALRKAVLTQHKIVSINGINKTLRCSNGYETHFDHAISTMPLDLLIDKLQEKSSTEFYQARPHLRCASVLNLNLGIKRPSVTDNHWVYYPETQFPFYRLGFPANLTASMVPDGHSSISGECSHLSQSPQEITARSARGYAAISRLFNLDPTEIVSTRTITIPHAYVIFDRWRDANLPHILEQLEVQYHIISTGRYGAWKYASMQEALLDGKIAAEKILQVASNKTIRKTSAHEYLSPS
jgi:protoporphyrinogen oxidase